MVSLAGKLAKQQATPTQMPTRLRVNIFPQQQPNHNSDSSTSMYNDSPFVPQASPGTEIRSSNTWRTRKNTFRERRWSSQAWKSPRSAVISLLTSNRRASKAPSRARLSNFEWDHAALDDGTYRTIIIIVYTYLVAYSQCISPALLVQNYLRDMLSRCYYKHLVKIVNIVK